MSAWRTTYVYWFLLRSFAPVLVWNFFSDCLTDYLRLLALAAKLCTSSGVKLLRWLPDWLPTITGFSSETLHQFWCETFTVIPWRTTYDYWLLLRNFAPVLVWNFYVDCLTDHLRLLVFAARLWTFSGSETFTVIARLTTYDYLLLPWNFATVLVWNFYGDCLTDYLRLLAFAAKLCTSSSVKLLRWLPDRLTKTTGFCCETLHQFWCENLTVIAWRTTYDYCLLLRNCTPVLVSNFYYDCLTDYLRLLAFAAKLWTCSGSKTFTVIARLTTYDYRFLPRNFPPFLV